MPPAVQMPPKDQKPIKAQPRHEPSSISGDDVTIAGMALGIFAGVLMLVGKIMTGRGG